MGCAMSSCLGCGGGEGRDVWGLAFAERGFADQRDWRGLLLFHTVKSSRSEASWLSMAVVMVFLFLCFFLVFVS